MSKSKGQTNAPVIDRIKRRTAISDDGCWVWNGYRDSNGYGRIGVSGSVSRLVHRVAYIEIVGSIQDGMTLDHLCRNTACWNPAHLEPVTLSENSKRQSDHAIRSDYCGKGHAFTEKNTGLRKEGWRYCKQCNRDRVAAKRKLGLR